MSTFWKNLHRMSQDQMFAHGHLSPHTALQIAAKRQAQDARERTPSATKRSHKSPWLRLAAFR